MIHQQKTKNGIIINICVIALYGCGSSKKPPCRNPQAPFFPESRQVLQLSELKGLIYYKLIDSVDPNVSDVIFETWASQRFLADADIVLRYRNQVKPGEYFSQRKSCPAAVGLDARYPLNVLNQDATEAFVKLLASSLQIPQEPISSAVKQIRKSDSTKILRLNAFVVEIALKEIEPRGWFVSIDFYNKDFYERTFPSSPVEP